MNETKLMELQIIHKDDDDEAGFLSIYFADVALL